MSTNVIFKHLSVFIFVLCHRYTSQIAKSLGLSTFLEQLKPTQQTILIANKTIKAIYFYQPPQGCV